MKLREYQRQAIDSIYTYFSTFRGNPLAVLPTGSGKSHVLAHFIKEAMEWPNQKILLLSHVKEILEQNIQKIIAIYPDVPLGIYSAGMKKKQLGRPITVASVQSIYKLADKLGYQSLLLIDEAHLVPRPNNPRSVNGMYLTLIEGLKRYNPKIKIIGLTATPYRLKSGLLTEGKDAIFTDICFEVTISELIDQGFLAPLISKAGKVQGNLSSVPLQSGEFVLKDMRLAMEADDLTHKAIAEVMRLAPDRKSFLFFCADVEHSMHVCDALNGAGFNARFITGKTPKQERERTIKAFKEGPVNAVTNCNVFTTGFDYPGIECIVLLRGTKSPGLYTQMVGRGSRISPGKRDCLVLDFAGNIERHGPVDSIRAFSRGDGKGSGAAGAPVKICPQCQQPVLIALTECPSCGHAFPEPEISHDTTASGLAILSRDIEPEILEVDKIVYSRHEKPGKPDSLKVTYHCGFYYTVSEWVCLEHGGFARNKADKWWKKRDVNDTPKTVTEALETAGDLLVPGKILIRRVGKYPEICGYNFNEDKEPEINIYDSQNELPWEVVPF